MRSRCSLRRHCAPIKVTTLTKIVDSGLNRRPVLRVDCTKGSGGLPEQVDGSSECVLRLCVSSGGVTAVQDVKVREFSVILSDLSEIEVGEPSVDCMKVSGGLAE